MRWIYIDKSKSTQPSTGTYTDWKSNLAEEGMSQCVYCALPDARFGGERNFHVEHFKPKSKFQSLTNDFRNLFYACSICNSFKGNDWPAEPCTNQSIPAYVNPSEFDYNKIFSIENFRVTSNTISSSYMTERLYLNRPHLILERRIKSCLSRFKASKNELENLIEIVTKDGDIPSAITVKLAEIVPVSLRVSEGFSHFLEVKPYQKPHISRP